ncbi:thioredoxin domain-containing protein [Alkalihalobacillus macyae]|uniref:DsbA family protein n=1 Tax=Guptibacillus hwajinpoensis TaxID=208199 RepID=UPI00273C96EA|nr:thioredoxin domain-containing protein [Alkalihalobacillus macyae]MDP4552201.1 thioredoxin domain-containing protein [Alkalihalobacillus macyae]
MAKKKLKKSVKWLLVIIGIITPLALLFLLNQSSVKNESITKNQPYLGDEIAPVEVIEFGDYKCSSCKSLNQSFFPLIQEELIATGKVKFYFIHYPYINEDSKRTAEFAEVVYEELGNDVFWQFHHVLYDQQPNKAEQKDVFTIAFLEETLGGLVSEEETTQVVKAYENGLGEKAVELDLAYADKVGVNSAPSLYVDGKRFKGSTMAEFKKMVEESTNE